MAEILHDFSPLLRVYKDGRIERLNGEEVVPAATDPETGSRIKDIQILPEINVSARLYLPGKAQPGKKLPLLIYFHGGAFVIESAFSPSYQNHLKMLGTEANVIIVSVNYRLAPEYPLPIAHEDSWLALKWVASHSNGDGHETWINHYADFNHVYLAGDSAGGNIAHNLAIRIGSEKLGGFNFKLDGVILCCPFFWGNDLIAGEEVMSKNVENLWLLVHPSSSGLDDPLINPEKDPNLSGLGCDKVLVYVAGKDPLKHRGFYYKESLEKSGWVGSVDVVEIKEEEHVFHLFAPTSANAMSMMKGLVSFLNHAKD